MIKGILMSVEGTTGVVLTQEGAFKKVSLPKSLQARIGEEVMVPLKTFQIPKPLFSVLAACLVLFTLIGVWGVSSQNHAVAAYISFDSNPSFEAGVNQDLKIVSLKPLNSDGKRVLSKIQNAKTMSLSNFTKRVANVLDQEGYFKENPKMVVSTTLTSNIKNESKTQLEKQINTAIQSIQTQQDFVKHDGSLSVVQTSSQERTAALRKGLTAGKYALYLKAKKVVPSVTPEKVKQMTVNQLLEVQPKRPNPAPSKTLEIKSHAQNSTSRRKGAAGSTVGKGQPHAISKFKDQPADSHAPGQIKKHQYQEWPAKPIIKGGPVKRVPLQPILKKTPRDLQTPFKKIEKPAKSYPKLKSSNDWAERFKSQDKWSKPNHDEPNKEKHPFH